MGYGIGFDRRSRFSFPGGELGQNVLIFATHMSCSALIIITKKAYQFSEKGQQKGQNIC